MAELSKSEQIENSVPGDSTVKQVLIAEDEPGIRSLLQKLLRLWGYRSLVASDGKEALEVAADHPGDIDLLLTDVTMPKIDGQELAGKLSTKNPFLKVILMSGFSQVQVVLRQGWRFVQKPFRPRDLKETIQEVMKSPT